MPRKKTQESLRTTEVIAEGSDFDWENPFGVSEESGEESQPAPEAVAASVVETLEVEETEDETTARRREWVEEQAKKNGAGRAKKAPAEPAMVITEPVAEAPKKRRGRPPKAKLVAGEAVVETPVVETPDVEAPVGEAPVEAAASDLDGARGEAPVLQPEILGDSLDESSESLATEEFVPVEEDEAALGEPETLQVITEEDILASEVPEAADLELSGEGVVLDPVTGDRLEIETDEDGNPLIEIEGILGGDSDWFPEEASVEEDSAANSTGEAVLTLPMDLACQIVCALSSATEPRFEEVAVAYVNQATKQLNMPLTALFERGEQELPDSGQATVPDEDSKVSINIPVKDLCRASAALELALNVLEENPEEDVQNILDENLERLYALLQEETGLEREALSDLGHKLNETLE
jgi:hypothetical protein